MRLHRLPLPLLLAGIGASMAADSLDFTGRLDRIAPENITRGTGCYVWGGSHSIY